MVHANWAIRLLKPQIACRKDWVVLEPSATQRAGGDMDPLRGKISNFYSSS